MLPLTPLHHALLRARTHRADEANRADGARRAFRPGTGLLVAAVLTAGLALGGAPASAAPPAPEPSVSFSTSAEAPSRYQRQVSCDPNEKPGAAALRDLLRQTYGKANSGGTSRACSWGGTSEHKEGRAYDWMLNAGNASDKAMADAFLAWLTGPDAQGVRGGNAHRLGIQYVIWNRQTWQSWTGAWKSYSGASPHTDHVHISLSWDGAFKRTSWWTGKAVTRFDLGPCQKYIGELAPPYAGPNYSACPKPVDRSTAPAVAVLSAGQQLVAGDQLVSPSGRYRAAMQSDGNFVVYASDRPLWHARTFRNPGARAVVQHDGNFVVYSTAGRPLWYSRSYGNSNVRLVMQDDGNLVLYRSDNRPLWNTGTNR